MLTGTTVVVASASEVVTLAWVVVPGRAVEVPGTLKVVGAASTAD